MKNRFEIEEDEILSFQVSIVDAMMGKDKRFVDIRVKGGAYISMPEIWFERMCDWYYENHKSRGGNND